MSVHAGTPVTAPAAPGRLGSAPEPAQVATYLDDLDAWLRARRLELDEVDGAALAAGRGAEVATDMGLALSLWKAVSDRYQLVVATWDGGRVLGPDRERISALVWGRLDGASSLPGGLAVSMPEACRLTDALTGQLRARLALSPGADAASAQVADLRAQLERIRDQIGLEPAFGRDPLVERLAGLMLRLDAVADKARRGADVGGLLAPLEQDAATFERDLIVGNARRRDARDQVVGARELRDDLEEREAALRHLADTCVATVDPAPRLAVPDVEALGPVPNTPEAIGPYLARLDRVSQALALAQERYGAALAEHAQLVDLLDAYTAKARALGLAEHPDLVASGQRARDVLERRPAPLAVARQLVATYQTWLSSLAPTAVRPSSPDDTDAAKGLS